MTVTDDIPDLPTALLRIAQLVELVDKLSKTVELQAARIAELEEKLRQNSSNSSKPPSSDGPGHKPARPAKKKSGRKPGGQPGHAKRERTLLPAETPAVCCELLEEEGFVAHFTLRSNRCGHLPTRMRITLKMLRRSATLPP